MVNHNTFVKKNSNWKRFFGKTVEINYVNLTHKIHLQKLTAGIDWSDQQV